MLTHTIPTTDAIEQHLMGLSLAIRPPVVTAVDHSVQAIPRDLDRVEHYKTGIIDWLRPIVDLQGFHVYPTNGITEGLNYWQGLETRTIVVAPGEYQWVKPRHGRGGIIRYLSNPDAATGNYRPIPTDTPVAIDLAYVGSTDSYPMVIPDNVEFAFYSLSKSFGLRNIRTGWMFSRSPIEALEQLVTSGKYYNLFAHHVAEAIIQQFSPTYIHDHFHEIQMAIVDCLPGAVPSDSVWLATTTDDKYERFRRGTDTARLNLSGLYHGITQ